MKPSESRFSWQRLSDKFEDLPPWVLLAVAAVLYIPLAFLGYGSDSDAFSVVRTGQHFVETFDYVPSRLPGFFVHEVFVYFLNLVGGSLLSNLGTVVMALISLNCFRRICLHYQVPHATLLTAILMVQPFFWVNAASTIDYLWALGFYLLGFDLLLNRKYLPGTIALALAIGSRLSTVLPVGLFFIFLLITRKDHCSKLILAAIGTAAFGFVLYLPPLDFLEWDVSRWLVLSTGDPALWTPLLRFGRFFYKNLMFFSLPVILWLLSMVIYWLIKKKSPDKTQFTGLIWVALAIVLVVELMFLRIPIEMEYLLPILPFMLILVGMLYPKSTWQLWLLFALVVLSNFLWINPARSITPNQASEVIYGLWLEPGYLLQDIASRLALLMP